MRTKRSKQSPPSMWQIAKRFVDLHVNRSLTGPETLKTYSVPLTDRLEILLYSVGAGDVATLRHYCDSPLPGDDPPPRIQSHRGTDWCHLCGRRAETRFVAFTIPANAEHSTQDGDRGYFRLCETCVRSFIHTIERVQS